MFSPRPHNRDPEFCLLSEEWDPAQKNSQQILAFSALGVHPDPKSPGDAVSAGTIYRMSQEECAILRESVPYVKVYRYNPKHLYPKLNGYGDNGQRKVRSSCGSTYCTFSDDALRVLCACPWDWNAVNIVPACPCKVRGTLRTTTALMRVFM